jgi:tetratricopeptide (TPR) repeat protein
MSTSLVTSYYLKAYDAYPFDLAEVEENLDYALAYDPEHQASLCLKSRYYLYDLNWIGQARELAERAVALDPQNPCAAAALLNCMIEARALNEALRFLDYINRKVPMPEMQKIAYMAFIMDLKMEFKLAINYYKRLILLSKSPEQKDRIEQFIDMLKQKRKLQAKQTAKSKVKR